jgi:enoyl-[acyl-carrier protein] reductase II
MNRITELFGIKYPIIQGGMIWVSGSKLAAAVSNAGGLGLVGAGSMKPELLDKHLTKIKKISDKPFGVNLPIFSAYADAQVEILLKHKVKIVFTSAGNPKKYTKLFKENGMTVVHVVPSPLLAQKSEAAGVDAIVAEGFEAGGHNGTDETTTLVLIPQVVDSVKIPVIAAGGIGDGRTMAANFALGAEGVQVGTRFAASIESSAHENFKKAIIESGSGDTRLLFKKLIPVRLKLNEFAKKVYEMEACGATKEELIEILGKGRAKAAIFDGELEQGEIEIGQISGLLNNIPTAGKIVENMMNDFNSIIKKFGENY